MATLTQTKTVTQQQLSVSEPLHARAYGEHTLPLAKESSVVPRLWMDELISLDHKLSMTIFTLPSLGRFEYALSLPGSMFGIPLYSLVILPFVVGAIGEALSSTMDGVAHLFAAFAVLLGVAYWALCVIESVSTPPDREHTGVVRAFYPLGKKLGTIVTLCAPHLSVWVMGLSSQEARGAASYYIAVFYVTQMLVEMGKTGVWRVRPVGRFRAQLQTIGREVPQIQNFLLREHAINLSFPSGDAAGSTTFAAVCFAVTPREWLLVLAPIWMVFPLISTFSRVYFRAHFLTDVFAGHAIAGATAIAFMSHFGDDVTGFSWGALVYCELPVIAIWVLIQMFKPKSAESIYNADNLIESFSTTNKRTKAA